MDTTEKFNLAFSGGGFRATFYCVGAYRRLVELGLHKRISKLSSVSGGSIAAGAIMTALASNDFASVQDFDLRVTEPLRHLAQINLRRQIFASLIYSWPWRLPRTTFSRALPRVLSEELLGNKRMMELPTDPEWSCNCTCLNTMKRFRFKVSDMQDTSIGTSQDMSDITVAFAVAASAAFPFMFAPMKLNIEGRKFNDHFGVTVYAENEKPQTLYLTDGGVYDNLGSETIITDKIPYLILDASSETHAWEHDFKENYFRLNKRTLETTLNQIVLLRRRLIYNSQSSYGMQLLLSRPVSKILNKNNAHLYSHIDLSLYQGFDPRVEALTAALRTDLDSFHDFEIDALMWSGAVKTDLAVKALMPESVPESELTNVPQLPNYSAEAMVRVLKQGGRRRIFGVQHNLHE